MLNTLYLKDGRYEIQPGYYYYKQVSRAGQPGMKVARTVSMDSELLVIAFASNGTRNKNAFVVVNTSQKEKSAEIEINGNNTSKFRVYRTSGNDEKYKDVGEIYITTDKLIYTAPPNSVTTFFSTD